MGFTPSLYIPSKTEITSHHSDDLSGVSQSVLKCFRELEQWGLNVSSGGGLIGSVNSSAFLAGAGVIVTIATAPTFTAAANRKYKITAVSYVASNEAAGFHLQWFHSIAASVGGQLFSLPVDSYSQVDSIGINGYWGCSTIVYITTLTAGAQSITARISKESGGGGAALLGNSYLIVEDLG
jgi:hypothetical protein